MLPSGRPNRWSDEFKAQVVTEALEPGASVSAIARRIGIHPSQLFAWRRDARAERHGRERHSSCGVRWRLW
ncbi:MULTISPECIES: transposase [unclassified Bradyrhizobium]|uniref:transposase n=1 Tax=unclassified Bradyrhizobium TaxID=2631580 RepID=UPI00247A42B0|nr:MULTISPECIES: transposase [unclassified Bradyrhizobium]